MSRTRTPPLAAALEHALRRPSAQGVLYSASGAQRLGIAPSDLECLDIVALNGEATAGALAAATGLTTGAVTGVIDRLEQAGLAARSRDAEDRRKVVVRALPALRQRVEPHFAPMRRAMAKAMARYSADELSLILDFLETALAASVTATKELRASAD